MGWGNAWCLCWGSLTTELHQTEPQGAEIHLTLMEKGVDEWLVNNYKSTYRR